MNTTSISPVKSLSLPENALNPQQEDFDFLLWARAVKKQMVAALQKSDRN